MMQRASSMLAARRRVAVASCSSSGTVVGPSTQARHVAFTTPINSAYPGHYNPQQKLVAGQDVSLRMTDFYDGYTDDFGVFKEGAPATMRYEYIRAPEHLNINNILTKTLWSPLQCGKNLRVYSPFHWERQQFSSRDRFGHRSGALPGDRGTDMIKGHYKRRETRMGEESNQICFFPQPNVPKWLAAIANEEWRNGLIGFFLYANGAYVAEMLTHKQLPKLTYNKPHLGYLPTIGQTVQLSQCTFGKEVHSVQMYPGHAGAMCTAPGTAAVVLRGSEPNLVPLMLPSREVRLFDSVAHAVYGRRAGLMNRQTQAYGREMMKKYKDHRPRAKHISKAQGTHMSGGGNDKNRNPAWRLDWRELTAHGQSTKHFLSGYILRGRKYNAGRSTAELKARTWGFGARDPLYR